MSFDTVKKTRRYVAGCSCTEKLAVISSVSALWLAFQAILTQCDKLYAPSGVPLCMLGSGCKAGRLIATESSPVHIFASGEGARVLLFSRLCKQTNKQKSHSFKLRSLAFDEKERNSILISFFAPVRLYEICTT